MKHIGVLTSGGDAPGMNAAVRAVVRKGIFEGLTVSGIRRGFAGLVGAELLPMTLSTVGDIIHRGGTFLGTARSEAFLTEAGQAQAVASLRGAGIDGLVVIGGDGSLQGAATLDRLGVPVIGVPATIDNDIPDTDQTIGFDTAVNTVVDALNKLRDTATSHERTFIVEVMGRHAGFIAVAAGIAGGAEAIMIPEMAVSYDEVAARLQRSRERGKRHSIILVAEGVGNAFDVARELGSRLGDELRVTVLGHLQRGGSPTATDRILASTLGAGAVELLISGQSGLMITMQAGRRHTVPLASLAGRRKELSQAEYELALQLSI